MLTEFVIIAFVCAWFGALVSAAVGWLKSNPPEPFDGRKFALSTIIGLLAAAAIAAGLDYTKATSPLFFLAAFLLGSGVNLGVNQIGGLISASVARRLKIPQRG